MDTALPPGALRFRPHFLMFARKTSRREVLAGGLAALAGLTPRVSAADDAIAAALRTKTPGGPVSPLVFGANEIGVMDGGAPSATFDAQAGVTARRFGGDLTTTYNWVNNACNAGKNHKQSNGAFLLDALSIPDAERARPGVVVETMHEASLAMGARSLVTLPLSPFVAADLSGPVAERETAPSSRFTPTRWSANPSARAPIDRSVCDVSQFLTRLMEKYGDAKSSRGIFAFALDNEPGLWTQNHPRIAPVRMPIDEFIARSIAAARTIKAIDPSALVFGPSSWGATGMASFQNAPDWPAHARYGNFLSLYLDAFRKASEQDGRRLLDTLDVHWYPFSTKGELFRTDTADLDEARMSAPRSLTEEGFIEESWVSRALRHGGEDKIGLPILPCLNRIVARNFPGTNLSISEFNYGLGKRIPSALALADALGRYATGGVYMAAHWGSLAEMLGQSYRLYRAPDARGGGFAGRAIAIDHGAHDVLSAYAAEDGAALRVVAINRSGREIALDLAGLDAPARAFKQAQGFDAASPVFAERPENARKNGGAWRVVVPALSARRYLFA
ncbi:MAG: glycoside hydrolase family 44 protein [Rhodoblastus sp.]